MKRQRKQLIKPIQSLSLCILLMILNLYHISTTLFEEDNHSEFGIVAYAQESTMKDPSFLVVELDSVSDTSKMLLGNSYAIDEPVEVQQVSNIVTLDSVSFKNQNGVTVNTRPVEIDVAKLMDIYRQQHDIPAWDSKEKIDVISVLWYFLVEEQKVPEENAAGILGNIYTEGVFGIEEGSNDIISSIEDARTLLGKGECGYGVAQWTYNERQRTLLKYYELAYAAYPDDWEAVCVVAECAMLIEEIKGYNIFSNIYLPTTIEDATGRVGCIYEVYDKYWEDWSFDGSNYTLIKENGSGSRRLQNAVNIYEYFTR